LTTPEAGNIGLDDEGHLAYALAEARVIVTQDGDFLGLAQKGIPHAGIVYYEPRSRSVKEIIRGLILIYEVLTPEDMVNHVEFL
jgi:predicted nuclease of predicted toxin-antitoxin system